MNLKKSLASAIVLLSSAGVFGETYTATDVASLTDALGKAVDGDVIECAAGDYPLTAQIEISAGVTVRGAGAGKTIFRRNPSVASMRIAYLNHADAVLEQATLRDGKITASVPAGGVLIDAGTLQDCEIVNCGLAHWGTWNVGSCVRLTSATARILRCSLHDNSIVNGSWGSGLALYLDGNSLADSCLVYNNGNEEANSSYVVHVKNGTLRNCTVTGNYTPTKAAVYVDNNNNNKVIDCIVCDNRGITPVTGQILGNGFDLQAANATVLNRCSSTVVENPGFMNADLHDYRLSPASPYVDTGSDGTASATSTDLTGTTPRLCDTAVDPGCYEAVRGTTPACVFVCAKRVNLTGDAFTLKLFSANAGDDPAYSVDWGDGTPAETVHGETATHAYANAGSYEVRLSVSGAETYVYPNCLTVKPKNLYVSYAGEAVAPYDDPMKATSSIEDAVAAAANGSTIWVAPDVRSYRFSKASQLCIREGIKIIGQTDEPTEVVFVPNKANTHRMFLLGNANAGLYNLTISGGFCEKQQFIAGDCVCIEPTGGTVSNCVMRNVNDTKWGNVAAGVYMQGGLVTHCVLSNLVASAAENNKPGMVASIAGGSMENCLITQNRGTGNALLTACGVVALSGSGRLVNCTIAGNQMDGPSGLYIQSTTAKVINCLIGDNVSAKVAGDTVSTYVGYSGGKAIDVRDCFVNCAAEIKINDTCQTGNLGFANAGARDYHIIVGSCAQDAGTLPTGYVPPATDLDGADRMDDGKIDIGCYELHVSGVVATFTASAQKGAAPFEVTFEATVVGADPNAVTYEWDVFGDGSEIVVTDVPRLVYTYETFGNYTTKLSVRNGAEVYPALNTQPFVSYPGDIYVNAANETPEAPYDTPAKAAKNIPEAVAVASDGSAVHVGPGTYAVPVITLAEGIAVVGTTGNPEDVILRPAGNSVVRPFLLNHPDAKVASMVMSGFTAGNNYDYGKGAYIDALGGTVSNCVIRNCKTLGWGASGGGIYMVGPGLVTHCVISNCQASSYSDGGRVSGTGAIYMTDGVVRNCLIVGNSVPSTEEGTAAGGIVAVRGGVFENCTLAGNAGRVCAGVYSDMTGVVRNCVIAGGQMLMDGQPETAVAWSGTAAKFSHCTVDADVPNDTCAKDVAPFVSASSGNYRLALGSAALDFGLPQEWMTEDATDLDGQKRVDGDAPDAGCYEAKSGVFSASFKARDGMPTEAFAPLTVDFDVSVAFAGGEGVTCYWYKDAETEPFATTDAQTLHYEQSACGKTNIRLVVKDNETGSVFEVSGFVTVYSAPRTVYVVPEESAVASAEPYASWATAAKDLPSAYAAALPGATILLSNGVYRTSSQLAVNKLVTISGNGSVPEATRIVVSGGSRAFYLDYIGATVANLTLEGVYNGGYQNRGGLVYVNAGGMITNCVLRNGKTTQWEGTGAAVYMKNGVLTHCVITNCVSGTSSGSKGTDNCKGLAVYIGDGRMENCLLAYNKVNAGSTYTSENGGAVYLAKGSIVNCTVVSNVYTSCGGIFAEGGTVANCLIVGNEATVLTGDVAQWRGNAECFKSCLTDTDRKINETCLTGSTEVFRQARMKRSVFIPLGSSAARDAGDRSFVGEATDLYGKPRVVGPGVDLGCAESQSAGISILIR